MWKRASVLLVVVKLCIGVALAAQAQEFTKGTYVAHPGGDASATIEITFADDGKVTVKMNGNLMVEGKYVVKADRLEFLDQTGPIACAPGQNGAYTWKLDGTRITFKAIDDKCEGRFMALTNNQWTLASKTSR